MITIAQTLGRKNEKASFLGLASFNSPLKQFFFLDQDWENSTAFRTNITPQGARF